jgi:hypothetical protein
MAFAISKIGVVDGMLMSIIELIELIKAIVDELAATISYCFRHHY